MKGGYGRGTINLFENIGYVLWFSFRMGLRIPTLVSAFVADLLPLVLAFPSPCFSLDFNAAEKKNRHVRNNSRGHDSHLLKSEFSPLHKNTHTLILILGKNSSIYQKTNFQ